MSVYDLDYSNYAKDTLPPDHRDVAHVQWMQALTDEIGNNSNLIFSPYRLGSAAAPYTSGSYNRRALVNYEKAIYESLFDNNNTAPPSTKWRKVQESFIGVNDRIRYNGEKIVLEYALNYWFGTVFRQPPLLSDIYIETNATVVIDVFRVGYEELSSSKVYSVGSSEYIIDGYSFATQFNFTIWVPADFYTSLGIAAESAIRNFADKYVAAGMIYKIQTY